MSAMTDSAFVRPGPSLTLTLTLTLKTSRTRRISHDG